MTKPSLPLCAVPLAFTAALTGCSEPETKLPTVGTVAVFDPDSGNIPLPSDLLLADTTDGTLNIPNPDSLDAFTSLNSLDGWSTLAPVSFAFSSELNNTTVQPGVTVRMFQVTMAATGEITGDVGDWSELTAGVDYVAFSTGPNPVAGETFGFDSIVVLPLRPLEPSALGSTVGYVVVTTRGVLDLDGNPVERPLVWGLAAGDTPTDNEELLALKGAVKAQLAVAEAFGLDADEVSMSTLFRTQSVGAPLAQVGNYVAGDAVEQANIDGLLAANPALLVPAGGNSTADPLNTASVANFTAVALGEVAPGGTDVDVYQGELTLPTYLDPAALNGPSQDLTPLGTRWQSRFEFAVPGETERNLQASNPFPQVKSTVTVPVLVTVPAGSDGLTELPTVIFQHGITSNRASMLGGQPAAGTINAANSIAGQLAEEGFACVSIDMPLHGIRSADSFGNGDLFVDYATDDANGAVRERTYGLDLLTQDGSGATTAAAPDGTVDSSGAHFINLPSLRTSRDNLNQAVADLLWLRSVIGDIDLPLANPNFDLDASDVSFVGVSLGGMVGTPFLRYAAAADAATADDLSIEAAVLAVPGGGIAELLSASVSFGPTLQAGIAAAAGVATTDPSFPGILASFIFAAQGVLDSVDPLNHAASLAASQPTPILLTELIGEDDGSGPPPIILNDSDRVIPNTVELAPGSGIFKPAGTEPFITALELDSITADDADGDPDFGAVRFLNGVHGSMVSPFASASDPGATVINEATAFADNAKLLRQFISTAGTQITVSDLTTVQKD